jgi:hypothetical protein
MTGTWWFYLLVGVAVLLPCSSTRCAAAPAANLVANGSFDQDADAEGLPPGWTFSGRGDIVQTLTLDAGRDGGKCAKLDCTKFEPGTPDSHAMVCQVGAIAVKRGQWYRLSFWVKGKGIARSICDAALSKTKPWGSSGIAVSFPAGPTWQHVEKTLQATDDVPADASRLQFWYASTGTLWLDDIVLERVEMKVEYHPQISTEGVRNFLPNSSFECGSAGWGSYVPNLTSWSGNAYQQLGELDNTTAQHGRNSLRLSLDKAQPLKYRWDYFDAVDQPIHTVLAVHAGWVPMQPGKRYVLSCFLKADKPNVPALLLVYQSEGGTRQQAVQVGTEWQRFSFPFTTNAAFAWTAVGLDLSKSDMQAATLWVDAVQLELADTASEYTPRAEVETAMETPALGNVFTDPEKGMTVGLSLWNGTDTNRKVTGKLVVTDFADQEVESREVGREVAPNSAASVQVAGLLSGKRGFFRAHWQPADHAVPLAQTLRCALIDPYRGDDSPFGMNHAYPWDFMLDLCKTAGMTWMRDWSAKWHTVEAEQGKWDFSTVDPQIDRVLRSKQNCLMLLPFASAPWSSGADMEAVRKEAAGATYREKQYVVACPAKDPALFRNYVAKTVEHYRDRLTDYEIMNEPLYTTYAVPQRFGYTMKDYLLLLEDSYETIKATQPKAQVIGGIGTWAGASIVHQFIDDGGLKWCDAMDIHLYPVTIPPELYEDELAECWQKMQDRGEAKPIWLTEFGCYADDDPYKTPGGIGDATMQRTNWPSERAASEGLVKTAAVFLTHGVTKVFYHAGTCGPLNGQDGGGIFFEYGGAPRKMYVALSALANLLGPAPKPALPRLANDHLRAHLFQTEAGAVAIVWATSDQPVRVQLPAGANAKDLMGNGIAQRSVELSATPVYLVGKVASLRASLGQAR